MKYIKFLLIIIIFFTINTTKVYATRSITDGTYIIESIIDNNKVFDAENGMFNNGTNIQLYSSNNTIAQKWIIKYHDEDYYTIASSLDESQVIDISGGKIANTTNIQLYKSNNTDAQKWNIIHTGKSAFIITSKKDSNYCLDLANGKTSNKTNVQLYKCNNTNAQKFKLVEIFEPKQTIEDGTYTINSAINENQVIDITGGKTDNGTNIQLYKFNNTKAQKWNIKHLGNGYYTITSKLNNNKCLDVANGSFLSSSNVQLYNCNNTDAQTWIIRETENGYYNILTKKDALALDLNNGSSTNGTNVQIYYNNGTNAQKFKFTKLEEKTLDSGIYTITSALDQNKVLDIANGSSDNNTNIQLYTSNNTNAQKWYITKDNDGYYIIRSGLNSSLYLSNTENTSGANILTSTKETKWIIEYVSDNEFYIISKDNGLYLNINNSTTSNGTNINILTRNESNAQKFSFKETEINTNAKTFSDGYYTINSKLDNSKVLDIANGSKNNNTNIQLYSSNNTNAQIWYLKYIDNGYYSITSALNPNTTLDLANGNTSDGTNIQLYRSNNSDAQKWKLKDDGNGNISIISKKANICITVNNSTTTNGTNIQANTCSDQNNQKFKLTRYTGTKTYTGIDVSQYQGTIDWSKVSSTNIGFVILRLGYGDNWTSQDDKKFITNVSELEKYNIPYGVYLYSYAKKTDGTTELNKDSESAASEAAHTLRLLNSVSYKPNLKTSVYIDMEDKSTQSLGKTQLTAIANKFCSTISSNGYGCGIYANKSWLTTYLDAKTLSNKYNIWLAEWITGTTHSQALSTKPTYNTTGYKLWQFSSSGSISGISGNVDMDLGYNIFD